MATHTPRGRDCAKSITGCIAGNLLISVICGGLIYATLKIIGVQFAGLIAIFVGFADLIPLIGATLGAIVAVIAAAIHSVPALIVVAIFFVAYQTTREPCSATTHPVPHRQTQPARRDRGDPGRG